MKIQSVEWLIALFCISRLACADNIFYCGRIGITDEHIKTAFFNSGTSPVDGFPAVMKIPHLPYSSDYTVYPIFLHGENRITMWSGTGVNWGVVLFHVMGTQSCKMNPNYLGRDLISFLTSQNDINNN
ncbi:CSEP0447 putative effector protein [Blumeria hordei DH14]|uniref:CSEP0447 putative effector protein n=1 Tax=Blumeria graminis f. sp. hordei (strain DH14) TaxID=546991 RepID=N1JH57_BLUG1|nr:CSEP0447 putative effector protein [Blumeria hordei DH14]